MTEPATLTRMEDVQREAEEARSVIGRTEEALAGLAKGTEANIDGLKIALTINGKVCIREPDSDEDLFWTPRQLLGLMGWTHKHIGGD